MAQQYLGSKISLISKLDIRYEGILHTVDSVESTIALAKVRSFGTEDRPVQHAVPARDEVYEFIIFKASDIKDLIVCESPKPPSSPPQIDGLAFDPAIISVTQKQPSSEAQKHGGKREPVGESSHSISPPPAHHQSGGHNRERYSNAAGLQGGFGQGRQQQRPAASYHQQNDWEVVSGRRNDAVPNSRSAPQQQQARPQQQYRNAGAPPGSNMHRPPYGNRQVYPRSAYQNKDKLRFDSDFDFVKANEQFQEELSDVSGNLSKLGLEGDNDSKRGGDDASESDEEASLQLAENDDDGSFYDKNTSFFDSISCEAKEKEEGRNNRPDWKKERMTNQETFGQTAVRSLSYRRGSRGYGGRRPQQYNGGNYRSGGGGYRGGYGGWNRPQQNYGQNPRNYQQQQRSDGF